MQQRMAGRFIGNFARSLAVCGVLTAVAGCGAGQGMAETAPTAPATQNRAPTLTGNGAATLAVGQAYRFQPTAADADNNTLTFSISGKPGWTTFNATTGALSGTPGAGDVGTSSVTITVSDGTASASLTFAITVNAASSPPPANTAPTISGNGTRTISAGTAYSFTPTASDPEGAPLSFSITGKPTWLAFSTATGALTGTPTAADAGAYSMTITVSDGSLSASLALSVTVTAVGTKSATLTWSAPTARTDGSALTNLAGYRIYYGTSAAQLTSRVDVSNPSLTTAVVDGLSAGTWYFAATAVDANGLESVRTSTVQVSLN